MNFKKILLSDLEQKYDSSGAGKIKTRITAWQLDENIFLVAEKNSRFSEQLIARKCILSFYSEKSKKKIHSKKRENAFVILMQHFKEFCLESILALQ